MTHQLLRKSSKRFRTEVGRARRLPPKERGRGLLRKVATGIRAEEGRNERRCTLREEQIDLESRKPLATARILWPRRSAGGECTGCSRRYLQLPQERSIRGGGKRGPIAWGTSER